MGIATRPIPPVEDTLAELDGGNGIPALATLKILPGHPDELKDVLRTLALVCGAEFHYSDKLADLKAPFHGWPTPAPHIALQPPKGIPAALPI